MDVHTHQIALGNHTEIIIFAVVNIYNCGQRESNYETYTFDENS